MRFDLFQELKNKELDKVSFETAESFLARGGKIQVIGSRDIARAKKIDAQKLLDSAAGTPYEKEVIALLRKQGIQVEV